MANNYYIHSYSVSVNYFIALLDDPRVSSNTLDGSIALYRAEFIEMLFDLTFTNFSNTTVFSLICKLLYCFHHLWMQVLIFAIFQLLKQRFCLCKCFLFLGTHRFFSMDIYIIAVEFDTVLYLNKSNFNNLPKYYYDSETEF